MKNFSYVYMPYIRWLSHAIFSWYYVIIIIKQNIKIASFAITNCSSLSQQIMVNELHSTIKGTKKVKRFNPLSLRYNILFRSLGLGSSSSSCLVLLFLLKWVEYLQYIMMSHVLLLGVRSPLITCSVNKFNIYMHYVMICPALYSKRISYPWEGYVKIHNCLYNSPPLIYFEINCNEPLRNSCRTSKVYVIF